MKRSLFILLMVMFCLGQLNAQKAPNGFSFVPQGIASVNGELIIVDAFFMGQTEVTNGEYRAFLQDLAKTGDNAMLSKCMPDSSLWLSAFAYGFNAPFVDVYHWHPAYKDYPVVNITADAAVAFCDWLTKKWNKEVASEKHLKGVYRLPIEPEWVRAARGDHHQWIYAWGDPKGKKNDDKFLRNKKGEFQCNFLSNSKEFKAIDTVYVKKGEKKNDVVLDNYVVAGPVKSYSANLFGLYCMCGNVSEMLNGGGVAKGGSFNTSAYSLRIDTPAESFSKPSPFVGFRVVFIPDPVN